MLRLHFVKGGVELSGLKTSTIPLVRFLTEIQTMKRLLVVAVVVMLSTSAVGCGCRPWGYWWRRAMRCDNYGQAVGVTAAPVMTYSDPYLAPSPAFDIVPGPIGN